MNRLIVVGLMMAAGALIAGCSTTSDEMAGKMPRIYDQDEVIKSDSGMEVSCQSLADGGEKAKKGWSYRGAGFGSNLIQINDVYFGKKFGDWTIKDIAFVNETLDRCDGVKIWQYKGLLYDKAKTKTIFNESYQSIGEQKAFWERRAATEEAERSYKARQEQCRARNPKAYEIFDAQKDVISAFNALQPWMERLEEQKQIAEMSGVVNLQQQRHLGEITYTHSQRLLKAFNKYKSAGGTAKSPAELKLKPYPNPCIGI